MKNVTRFTEDILAKRIVEWTPYKAYYKSKEFKPHIPQFSRWRHYRVRCADGAFRKVRMTIRDRKDLVKALLRYAAIDVFYSVAWWLSPLHKASQKLDGHKGSSYQWADNLLLGADLYFDLDAKQPLDLAGMEVARGDALSLVDKYDGLHYIQFTGGKGFGLDFEGEPVIHPIPARRISDWTNQRKLFINELLSTSQMSSLDATTSTDLLRVRRLPGTINSRTGYIARRIYREELRNSTAEDIILNTPRPCGREARRSPAKPKRADDAPPRLKHKEPLRLVRYKKRTLGRTDPGTGPTE